MLDMTITEIADEIVGGICSAGPERLDEGVRLALPQVLLPGAIDMVNFGSFETVPARFYGRKFVKHTPWSTLMRTTQEELYDVGSFVARKLSKSTVPITVIIPAR